jgi:hypothetical protein
MTEEQLAEVQAEAERIVQGRHVKAALQQLGVKRPELAAASKGALTAGAIYRIEAGRGTPAELVAVRTALATLVDLAEQRFTASVKDVHALIADLPENVATPAEPAKATAPAAKATTTRK